MNIPGYYYDSEKRRYFKVENSKTAPANAVWSSDTVKRRKLREQETVAAVRHSNLAKSRIKRARVLHDPLTGGFFAREYGAVKDDMQAACFADGLRHKGALQLLPLAAWNDRRDSFISRMLITGYDYKTGLCNLYAAYQENRFLATYLVRDKNGFLDRSVLANYRFSTSVPDMQYQSVASQISDIKYHEPSNSILVAANGPPEHSNISSVQKCSPVIDAGNEDSRRPLWLVPSPFEPLTIGRDGRSGKLRYNDYGSNCVAPAPASSSLVCAVGTSQGIVQWDSNFSCSVPTKLEPHNRLFNDVFAIDFHPNHGEVFRFGGRPGVLFTADTRTPSTAWSYVKLPSTITHLRCLNGGNQVLVAGLENCLGVYDLRFSPSQRVGSHDGDDGDSVGNSNGNGNKRNNGYNRPNKSRWRRTGGNTTEKSWQKPKVNPVIRFEHYHNAAHIEIGFAYDAPTGIVAAAHDDDLDIIALYSVRTGSRLRELELNVHACNKLSSYGYRPGPQYPTPRNTRVVQSLQFATFPGDRTPTLFAGSGPETGITAFSFNDDSADERYIRRKFEDTRRVILS
ncbi:hypothetical protein F5B22DRAFT_599122 [Xylaria bambusicola]|uniref:uncharacterized protein n=1 Tax=Xylaria bambusicola TaxID=326684 RepID=UPI0020078DCC|nr:uncharacterized protein F5B22DRAFT_599122 [Xylaria bambusicola]KAI0518422.1 hypothetical protein F5B22DRAFT_599122 [Xylaria bambusicola]